MKKVKVKSQSKSKQTIEKLSVDQLKQINGGITEVYTDGKSAGIMLTIPLGR